ncbi:MAG: gliding motility-associated C-terminal domain-containing protein [Flavobacteriales bacterium]|nr:MAG: gliding motility-associated C-terminal domain-containing protein [Flavobacteriales bacterium]
MKKQFYFIAIILLQSSALFAQFFNDGVKVVMDKNALLYVNATYYHKAGEILNDGQIIVEGNGQWENHSSNKVFDPVSKGTVTFNSSRYAFTGNATGFPHLVFKGKGIYYLKAKAEARLSLDLDDAEVQPTFPEALTLLNPNPSSLIRNNGFVNTTISKDASFLRSMKVNKEYLFPVGGSKYMRFVTVTPKDANDNSLAVSFIEKDPTAGGYSRLSKTKFVTEVNDVYYHILSRVSGNSNMDATFHTSSSEKFRSLVAWVKNTQWDRAISTNSTNNAALSPNLTQAILHKNADLPLGVNAAFALAQVENASPLEFYNAFSPDGDGKNDTWEVKNIDLFPDNDLKIFDRSGNLVYRAGAYNSAKYWDGQNVQSGTYVYILRVKIDGTDQFFKGAITMVKN